MVELLTALNALSPLGLAALLALVLWRQTGNKTGASRHDETIALIQTMRQNDLHELPEVAAAIDHMTEALGRIEAALNRIETVNAGAFATLIARLNGVK